MFDPKIGRWIEQDPLAFMAGDTNLYRYVSNEPTGSVDPTGLQKLRLAANGAHSKAGWIEDALQANMTAARAVGDAIALFGNTTPPSSPPMPLPSPTVPPKPGVSPSKDPDSRDNKSLDLRVDGL